MEIWFFSRYSIFGNNQKYHTTGNTIDNGSKQIPDTDFKIRNITSNMPAYTRVPQQYT